MTQNDIAGAPGAAPPLAEVSCCRDVPMARGGFEPSTEPLLNPGKVLDGRFLIQEAIGRSRMATIYRAEDMLHERRIVAVKLPLRIVESDPVCFTRFRHEEEIGLRLHHPLLLKFYSVTGAKSRPYLATEFLEGCTLDHIGRGTRPLPEGDSLRIVGLVCDALGYMHEKGVIHRDIKPANIMICRDGTLRVMDFGLASPPIRQRNVLAKLTSIFGTAEYMAPEQVENGPIDERTDIYGLGAILYELLTGSVPFKNEDPWQSAFQRTTGDPVAPRVLNPAISPQAEEIVLHALQRKPDDRYPSMAAFKADLSAPDRVTVTGYCQRLRPPRWKLSFQGTPVLAGSLIGIGVLVSLVLLFLFLRFGMTGR
ncbi:MAG: serine/threonine-protein kinase [Opitutaceae bacterium]